MRADKKISDIALSGAMAAYRRHPALAAKLAERLTKRVGRKIWRQAVALQLEGRVEPKHGMGIMLEREWRACEVECQAEKSRAAKRR